MRLIRVKNFNSFELNDMLDNKYLELLIDTKSGTVYHVHPKTGHSKAAAIYLRIPEDEINETTASHLVSALVEIDKTTINIAGKPTVKQVIIGKSSLETGHVISHSNEQFARAKLLVERLMAKSKKKGKVVLPLDIREHEFVLR